MRIFFCADLACAFFVNGMYLGAVDGFERSVELDPADGVFCELKAPGYAPLRFRLDEDFLFSPPAGVELYFFGGAVCVHATDFVRADPSLHVIWQKRLDGALLTLCVQGRVTLNLESKRGFFQIALPFSFEESTPSRAGRLILLESKTAFALIGEDGEVRVLSEGTVTERGERVTAEVPLGDCTGAKARRTWTNGKQTACTLLMPRSPLPNHPTPTAPHPQTKAQHVQPEAPRPQTTAQHPHSESAQPTYPSPTSEPPLGGNLNTETPHPQATAQHPYADGTRPTPTPPISEAQLSNHPNTNVPHAQDAAQQPRVNGTQPTPNSPTSEPPLGDDLNAETQYPQAITHHPHAEGAQPTYPSPTSKAPLGDNLNTETPHPQATAHHPHAEGAQPTPTTPASEAHPSNHPNATAPHVQNTAPRTKTKAQHPQTENNQPTTTPPMPEGPTAAAFALAFFETLLIGADPAPFLTPALAAKKELLRQFLGRYRAAVLTEKTDVVGLVYARKARIFDVRRFRVTLEDGKIANITAEA